MLDHHKKQFLWEHLNLVFLFNDIEGLIERKNNKGLLGTSYCLVQSHEGCEADGAALQGLETESLWA